MTALYVTGTDTEVGKTVVSCALLARLRAGGLRVAGFKPVASGCDWIDGGWRNDDALRLQAQSAPGLDYAAINPYALPLPQAPEIAARDAGVTLQLPTMVNAARRLQALVDAVVVEGVGGWLAPVATDIEQVDLVRALDVPVVLVVGLRLGCINHARLSARAIVADGCRLLGWIGNRIDPDFSAADDNVRILRQRLHVPCLGVLSHHKHHDANVHAAQIDEAFDAAMGLYSAGAQPTA